MQSKDFNLGCQKTAEAKHAWIVFVLLLPLGCACALQELFPGVNSHAYGFHEWNNPGGPANGSCSSTTCTAFSRPALDHNSPRGCSWNRKLGR